MTRSAADKASKEKDNERFTELTSNFSKAATPVEFDASLPALEPLSKQLDETRKKILEIILTDFSVGGDIEAERDVFQKLRNACARAGMLGNRADQIEFFKTIADPKFNNVVKAVGQGLIGMHIVPVVAKMINMALEGDKQCIKWVLEVCGMMPGKYDFYLNRYQYTHNTVNAGNINFEGKTDKELDDLIREFDGAQVAEVAQ